MNLTCQNCNQSFVADSKSRKYCSRKCYGKAQQGHPFYGESKQITKNCKCCGSKFKTGGRLGNASKNFCSWECRHKSRFRHGKEANLLMIPDLAYLAGLMDGEGHIILYGKSNGRVALRIGVTNTNKEVLKWIMAKTDVGFISSARRKNPNHKRARHWICGSVAAFSLLKQLIPFLIIKRRQAELAIDFFNLIKIPRMKADLSWQQEFKEEMHVFNRRGSGLASLERRSGRVPKTT